MFDRADANYDVPEGLDYIGLEPAEQRVALEAIQRNRRELIYVAIGCALLDHLEIEPEKETEIETAFIRLAKLENRPVDEYFPFNMVQFSEFAKFLTDRAKTPIIARRMIRAILNYNEKIPIPGLLIDKPDTSHHSFEEWVNTKILNIRVLEELCDSGNLIRKDGFGPKIVGIAGAFVEQWKEKYKQSD
jgi:hypothetical protein